MKIGKIETQCFRGFEGNWHFLGLKTNYFTNSTKCSVFPQIPQNFAKVVAKKAVEDVKKSEWRSQIEILEKVVMEKSEKDLTKLGLEKRLMDFEKAENEGIREDLRKLNEMSEKVNSHLRTCFRHGCP